MVLFEIEISVQPAIGSKKAVRLGTASSTGREYEKQVFILIKTTCWILCLNLLRFASSGTRRMMGKYWRPFTSSDLPRLRNPSTPFPLVARRSASWGGLPAVVNIKRINLPVFYFSFFARCNIFWIPLIFR